MDYEHSPQRFAETLQHLWESRPEVLGAQGRRSTLPSSRLTIAISREAGTQGNLIGKEVGRLLGWHVYDHELLEQIAQKMGLRANLLESVDERQRSWLLEATEAFLGAPWKSVTETGFVHHLVETVLTLGARGECVIVGRGAAFILPSATTFRVRLVAPVRERIATWGRNLGISEREAARQVATLDRERARFVQDHFFKDPADLRTYDLVLNVARLSVTQNAQMIADAVHHLQTRETEKHAAGSVS